MNGRITRDDMLMNVARIFALRGTCTRLRVGAVFSRDGRIIVTGYNGAPAGMPHCDHTCDCLEEEGHHESCRSVQPCMIAEHAERNGVAYAARLGLALEGSTLHVTHAPCYECARSIVNAGVERVIFAEYYRSEAGLELMRQGGLVVVYKPTEDRI